MVMLQFKHCENGPNWSVNSRQKALGQIQFYHDHNQHANYCNLCAAHSGRHKKVFSWILHIKTPFISLMHRSGLSVCSYRHQLYRDIEWEYEESRKTLLRSNTCRYLVFMIPLAAKGLSSTHLLCYQLTAHTFCFSINREEDNDL